MWLFGTNKKDIEDPVRENVLLGVIAQAALNNATENEANEPFLPERSDLGVEDDGMDARSMRSSIHSIFIQAAHSSSFSIGASSGLQPFTRISPRSRHGSQNPAYTPRSPVDGLNNESYSEEPPLDAGRPSSLRDYGVRSTERRRQASLLSQFVARAVDLEGVAHEGDTSPVPPAFVSTSSNVAVTDVNAERNDDDEKDLGSEFMDLSVDEKIQLAFELPEVEPYRGEYSCWLVKSLLIKGNMFLTDGHLCFYASLPREKGLLEKSGFLHKKVNATNQYATYWFVLKDDALNFYENSQDLYYPIGGINLKSVIAVEKCHKPLNSFRLLTHKAKYRLRADTEASMHEWMKLIKASMFRARNEGDDVKIVLPWSIVTSMEIARNPVGLDTMQFKVVDPETHVADEYYFAFLANVNEVNSQLQMIRTRLEKHQFQKLDVSAYKHLSRKRSLYDSTKALNLSNVAGVAGKRSTTDLLTPPEGGQPVATAIECQTSLPQLTGSTDLNSHRRAVTDNLYESGQSFEEERDTLGNDSSLKRTSGWGWVASARAIGHRKTISEGQGFGEGIASHESSEHPRAKPPLLVSQSSVTFASDVPTSAWEAEKRDLVRTKEESKAIELHDSFNLPDSERLILSHTCYLIRVIPRVGRAYITDRYLCFKSHIVGVRAKVIIPIQDIREIHKDRRGRSGVYGDSGVEDEDSGSLSQDAKAHHQPVSATSFSTLVSTFSYHGLYVLTRDQYEFTFDFHSAESRNKFFDTLKSQYEHVHLTDGVDRASKRRKRGKRRSRRKHSADRQHGAMVSAPDLPSPERVQQTRSSKASNSGSSLNPWLLTFGFGRKPADTGAREAAADRKSTLKRRSAGRLTTGAVKILEDVSDNPTSADGNVSPSIHHLRKRSSAPSSLSGQSNSRVEELNIGTNAGSASNLSAFYSTRSHYHSSHHHSSTPSISSDDQGYSSSSDSSRSESGWNSADTRGKRDVSVGKQPGSRRSSRPSSRSRIDPTKILASVQQASASSLSPSVTDSAGVPSRSESSAVMIDSTPFGFVEHPDTNAPPPQPLRITCLTIGSRGDVQPYIALCKRLMQSGHHCRIATHLEFKGWIESHGIEFREVGGNPEELMRLCVDNGMFTYSFLKEGLGRFRGWLDELLMSAWDACQGSDVLIDSPSTLCGVHIAEALGVAYFQAFTMPWTRTRIYPHPFAVPEVHMGPGYNYMTHVLIDQVLWTGIAPQILKWRKNVLNRPACGYISPLDQKIPMLYNFSPVTVPPPVDWPDWVHTTGYWFLDNPEINWTAPQTLVDFLEGKPARTPQNYSSSGADQDGAASKKPIVYIGFGSIIVPDPDGMTQIIVEAVKKAGVRAILSKGWSARAKEQAGAASTAPTAHSSSLDRAESDKEMSATPSVSAAFTRTIQRALLGGRSGLSSATHEQSATLVEDKRASSGFSSTEETASSDAAISGAELAGEFPDDIYPLDKVPHDWLFPKVAAVVHHGGAGTLSAGMRAGVPTIVKPWFGDQYFWADRMQDLGVGCAVRKLTVDKLAAALIQVTTDDKMKEKARLLGERIRSEDGVGNAVKCIYRDLEFARNQIRKLADANANSAAAWSISAPFGAGVGSTTPILSTSGWFSALTRPTLSAMGHSQTSVGHENQGSDEAIGDQGPNHSSPPVISRGRVVGRSKSQIVRSTSGSNRSDPSGPSSINDGEAAATPHDKGGSSSQVFNRMKRLVVGVGAATTTNPHHSNGGDSAEGGVEVSSPSKSALDPLGAARLFRSASALVVSPGRRQRLHTGENDGQNEEEQGEGDESGSGNVSDERSRKKDDTKNRGGLKLFSNGRT